MLYTPEYLESSWVRYERDSFFNDILSGVKRRALLSYLDGVDVKTLPRTLRQTEAIQHSEGALQMSFSHTSAARATGLAQAPSGGCRWGCPLRGVVDHSAGMEYSVCLSGGAENLPFSSSLRRDTSDIRRPVM